MLECGGHIPGAEHAHRGRILTSATPDLIQERYPQSWEVAFPAKGAARLAVRPAAVQSDRGGAEDRSAARRQAGPGDPAALRPAQPRGQAHRRRRGGADQRGEAGHKLLLTRAPGVELPTVVSEGEQRCLSIAAFFAELSTADDPSGIVFDDPVSSLDYKWREGVARRLVQEANTRQVIVFTHDVVFLLLLGQFAEEQGVAQLDQHVRQLSKGAGICEEELPWVAMPVKKKIGYLKNEWQAGGQTLSGRRAGHLLRRRLSTLYGLLREAWERALEEVLLGGVVERFQPSVQTYHIGTIADIKPEDCQTLDAAMTKCSKWLPGHDQAAAARAPVPEPTELNADIDALENWVAAIHRRRR